LTTKTVATLLRRFGYRRRLRPGVGHQTSNHKRLRQLGLSGHGRYAQLSVGTLASRRDAGPASISRRLVGAPAQRQCSKSALVLPLIVGRPASRQCSGSWSVLQPIAGALAHGRYSGTSLVPTQKKPRTGAQHHARLGPTRQWRRRATSAVGGQAGVRGVWPAPHR